VRHSFALENYKFSLYFTNIGYYRNRYVSGNARTLTLIRKRTNFQRIRKRRIFMLSSKHCENCGKLFVPERKHGKYCKESCRISAYKKRHGIVAPDFKLLTELNKRLPTPEERKMIELQSALRRQFDILADLERQEKSYLTMEKSMEQVRIKQEEYDLYEREKDPSNSDYNPKYYEKYQYRYISEPSKYEWEQAQKSAETAYKALKPIRSKISYAIDEIEGLKRKIEGLNEDLYIERNRTSGKIITSDEILQRHYDVIPFENEWYDLLGTPEYGFMMNIYGEKEAGKSTFALRLLKYLQNFGKCIYFSVEEGDKLTVQSKLRAVNIRGLDISTEQLPQAILKMASKYDFVLIDSLSSAKIDAQTLREARMRSKKATSYIGTLHVRTDGRLKGGTEFEHNPDIILHVDKAHKITVEKNRYIVGRIGAI
jgi:hypothetical protein